MNMTKPVIVLTVICIVCSALLGATYTATAPLIAASEKAASDAAMIEVLPGAASFTEIPVELEGVLTVAKDDGGLGYAFKVQDKGFGGAYTIMVGIGADGKITGAKLLDNSETPGLGSKTGSADFIQRFVGVESSGVEGVQAITGATISSNAFKRCVQTAYTAFDSVNA